MGLFPDRDNCGGCDRPCEDNPYNEDEECWAPNPFVEALVKAGENLTDVVVALLGGRKE
jgi:hypothetical protein